MAEDSVEKKVQEAAHATRIAHEMTSEAREAQMHEGLVKALREALRDDTDEAPILVKRIPFICIDIRDMKNDMKWIKWLVIAALAASLGTKIPGLLP